MACLTPLQRASKAVCLLPRAGQGLGGAGAGLRRQVGRKGGGGLAGGLLVRRRQAKPSSSSNSRMARILDPLQITMSCELGMQAWGFGMQGVHACKHTWRTMLGDAGSIRQQSNLGP